MATASGVAPCSRKILTRVVFLGVAGVVVYMGNHGAKLWVGWRTGLEGDVILPTFCSRKWLLAVETFSAAQKAFQRRESIRNLMPFGAFPYPT